MAPLFPSTAARANVMLELIDEGKITTGDSKAAVELQRHTYVHYRNDNTGSWEQHGYSCPLCSPLVLRETSRGSAAAAAAAGDASS